jgi:D-glycero-D-manno-heptose 1,7-bisphosphate phosphatase
MKRRAVFLDRDGVLVKPAVRNGYAYGPLSLAEFELLPGIAGPVGRIREAGFLTVLVTNQPGISRGLLDQATLDEMHARLRAAVPLDAVYFCPHTDADGCACRKPKPGMLLEAARSLGIDLKGSYFIGDTDRDMQAGASAGATPILLDAPYNQEVEVRYRVSGLAEAADLIVSGGRYTEVLKQ